MTGFLPEVSESLGAFPRIRRLLDNATSWLGKVTVGVSGEGTESATRPGSLKAIQSFLKY